MRADPARQSGLKGLSQNMNFAPCDRFSQITSQIKETIQMK